MQNYKDSNIEYWNDYYSNNLSDKPSDFAIHCLPVIIGKKVCDAGCGSGQDSLFFYNNGASIIGIDKCKVVIDKLNLVHNNKNGLVFKVGDLSNEDFRGNDVIYSRWVLHSMSFNDSSSFLTNACNSLNTDGLLLIECRSLLDSRYFINNHFRRPVKIEEIEEIVSKNKMEIIFLKESRGWSKIGEDDPLLIRLIAKKSVD